jgi:hypothetical protein
MPLSRDTATLNIDRRFSISSFFADDDPESATIETRPCGIDTLIDRPGSPPINLQG